MIFRTLRAKVTDEVLVFMKSKGVQSFGAVTWHLFGIIWISHAWEQHETVAAKRQLKAPYPRVKERINTSQYSFWIFIKDGFRTQILVVYACARLPHARSRRCADGQNNANRLIICLPTSWSIYIDRYRSISISRVYWSISSIPSISLDRIDWLDRLIVLCPPSTLSLSLWSRSMIYLCLSICLDT